MKTFIYFILTLVQFTTYAEVFLLTDGTTIVGKIIKRDEAITYVSTDFGELALENDRIEMTFLNKESYEKYQAKIQQTVFIQEDTIMTDGSINKKTSVHSFKLSDDDLNKLTNKEKIFYIKNFQNKWRINIYEANDLILKKYEGYRKARNGLLGAGITFTTLGTAILIIAPSVGAIVGAEQGSDSGYLAGMSLLYSLGSIAYTLIPGVVMTGIGGNMHSNYKMTSNIYEKITGKKLLVPEINLGFSYYPDNLRLFFSLNI